MGMVKDGKYARVEKVVKFAEDYSLLLQQIAADVGEVTPTRWKTIEQGLRAAAEKTTNQKAAAEKTTAIEKATAERRKGDCGNERVEMAVDGRWVVVQRKKRYAKRAKYVYGEMPADTEAIMRYLQVTMEEMVQRECEEKRFEQNENEKRIDRDRKAAIESAAEKEFMIIEEEAKAEFGDQRIEMFGDARWIVRHWSSVYAERMEKQLMEQELVKFRHSIGQGLAWSSIESFESWPETSEGE